MKIIKELIKKLIPDFLISFYHLSLAYIGAFVYGFPSKSMIVIGIAGTRGKTTVANMIWSCLTSSGYKVGLTGTANIRIDKKEFVNPYHMTMPGRFKLQKLLFDMKNAGCKFAIIETPSEGIEQFRHKGIAYDVAVMTTLYPEYLAVHKLSYERCKEMHAVIFKELNDQPKKVFDGKKVPKIIVVNNDIEEKDLFLNQIADKKITYAINSSADIKSSDIKIIDGCADFFVGGIEYKLGVMGAFNVQNALAAIATSSALGIKNESIKNGLFELKNVQGRMEKIETGQPFFVFVDYAHDNVSLNAVLDSVRSFIDKNSRIILITGAQGGGRDKKKRPLMGETAAKKAEVVIVTNEDPYNDDPRKIIEDVARGAEKGGKQRDVDLFVVEDRRLAIHKAFESANNGDVVLITGKGAEQLMELKGKSIAWDDRVVAKEELNKIFKHSK